MEFREIRSLTGMRLTAFCERYHIPYRTAIKWERGERTAPDYVLELLEFKVRTELTAKGDDSII